MSLTIKNVEECQTVEQLIAFISFKARENWSEKNNNGELLPQRPFSKIIGVSYASIQNYENPALPGTPIVPVFGKLSWLAGFTTDEIIYRFLMLSGDNSFEWAINKNDVEKLINSLSQETPKDQLLRVIRKATSLLVDSESQKLTDKDDTDAGLELSFEERITKSKKNKHSTGFNLAKV